jgi:ABC-type sugar transport system ATPase subunit
LGIRSENITPVVEAQNGALPARVLVVEPLGSHTLLTAQVGKSMVKVNAHADSTFTPDQSIYLSLSADKIRFFDKQSGQAL